MIMDWVPAAVEEQKQASGSDLQVERATLPAHSVVTVAVPLKMRSYT